MGVGRVSSVYGIAVQLPLFHFVAHSRYRRKGYGFAVLDGYGTRFRFRYAVRRCFKRASGAVYAEGYRVVL